VALEHFKARHTIRRDVHRERVSFEKALERALQRSIIFDDEYRFHDLHSP
jgi:hypothetical protein